MQRNVVGVFLTGYATIDTVYPAIDVGVQRVLAKPVDMDELLGVLEECLESGGAVGQEA